MTDHFDIAVTKLLDIEKGFTVDNGGPTNQGITLNFLSKLDRIDGDLDGDGDIDIDDIRALTPDRARPIYRKQFWDRYRYSQIAAECVAIKVLDMSVNMGPGQAHLLVQRAVNKLMGEGTLEVDGKLGPTSRTMLNGCDPQLVVQELRMQCKGFYELLQKKDPIKYGNTGGWKGRALS